MVLYGWQWHAGIASRSYAIMYSEMRVIELFCALLYAGPRLWGAFAALGYAGALFLALPHFALNPAIAASEGSLFVFAGVSAVLGKPDRPKAILAALWLLLAMFDAGYSVGWELPMWVALNGYWPALLCSVAFLAVGAIVTCAGASYLLRSIDE